MANRYNTPYVGVYLDGVWHLDVLFKKTWQARVFHWILNKSVDTSGVRHY